MIDRSFYYTIDISSGESKTLSTGLFMGIGIIEILTSTDFEEKTAKGIQLLFLSIVY